MEIQQAVVHHNNSIFTSDERTNDEKWPHTRQIKIAGRNHILHRWELHGKPAKHIYIDNSQEGIKVEC
jgi:hypothetical protein